MLNISRHIRKTTRLIVGLFALQILVTGFCLMTPQVHAAEMNTTANMVMGADNHCANNDSMVSSEITHDQACTHCEMPNELLSSKTMTLADTTMDAPVLLLLIIAIPDTSYQSNFNSYRHDDALPRSSSIIYNTNSRILI